MKTRKLNYKAVLKKLNAVHNGISKKSEPAIIIAEKLENGSYQIIETTKEYKRKEFIIENEKRFNEFLDSIKGTECTIIIDDFIEQLADELNKKVVKNCTDEELHFLIEDLEKKLEDENHSTQKSDKIILDNIKKIIGDDNNEII